MGSFMGDIASMMGVDASNIAQNSTSRKGNTELNMDDFLQLMIVQLTSQTIDDTMDTSDMINQMVQMQMVTALSNMTDTSVQGYANSLVGQIVTVGVVHGNVLEEIEIKVKGTGTYNGQQVIFGSDGNMYFLSQIMAVGRLPDENGNYSDLVVNPTYEFDVDGDGKDETVYLGEDGKRGTADDYYFKDVDGDGEKEKVYAGPDGKFGTDDDWYEKVSQDDGDKKVEGGGEVDGDDDGGEDGGEDGGGAEESGGIGD